MPLIRGFLVIFTCAGILGVIPIAARAQQLPCNPVYSDCSIGLPLPSPTDPQPTGMPIFLPGL